MHLVLEYCNDTTGQCNPSEKRLANDLHLSERQVRRSIKQAKDGGWLTRQRRYNTSNRYDFDWDRIESIPFTELRPIKQTAPAPTNEQTAPEPNGSDMQQKREEEDDGLEEEFRQYQNLAKPVYAR